MGQAFLRHKVASPSTGGRGSVELFSWIIGSPLSDVSLCCGDGEGVSEKGVHHITSWFCLIDCVVFVDCVLCFFVILTMVDCLSCFYSTDGLLETRIVNLTLEPGGSDC